MESEQRKEFQPHFNLPLVPGSLGWANGTIVPGSPAPLIPELKITPAQKVRRKE